MSTQFKVGDTTMYPCHGITRVSGIEERKVGDNNNEYYILELITDGSKLMVPTDRVDRVGLRALISYDMVEEVLEVLSETVFSFQTNRTWYRRQKEYYEMIKTGSVFEIAVVMRELHQNKGEGGFSYSEQKVFDRALDLLASELTMVSECDESTIKARIEQALNKNQLHSEQASN